MCVQFDPDRPYERYDGRSGKTTRETNGTIINREQ